MPTDQHWFLRKHEDGNIFGPLPFQQLARWASAAQIAPHDARSIDQETWMKAPMLPQLGMDWLVEITSDRYYGPTTLGAIQEFIRLGEINAEAFVINSCDGTKRQVQEMPSLIQFVEEEAPSPVVTEPTDEPPATRMSVDLQEHIRELEQSLHEERRALMEAEERYLALEARYRELAGQEAAI